MVALSYDPRSPAVIADPYPVYEQMRERDPVQYLASARLWVLSRHADCLFALRDPRLSASQGQRLRARRTALPPSMLNTDPPEHTRLRRAVAPAFTPAAMARVRPRLLAGVHARLSALAGAVGGGHEVDLVTEFARPIATEVLSRFLGLPDADLPEFAGWGAAVAANLDPFGDPRPGDPAAVAMAAMLDRFADQLHARSADPRDDAFSVLASAHHARHLSPAEALASAGLLVVGGLEPLTDLLSNSVAALLAAEPAGGWPGEASARSALEELLRFDPPIQFTARTALADVTIAGRVVRRGESVVALLGAANRDPARFARPTSLALDRGVNPHLSFGAGPHVCLGAPLARLVGTAVLAGLRDAVPPLRPGATAAVRRPSAVPRGYLRLPVRAGGAQR